MAGEYAAIRTRVVTTVSAVTNIGQVFNRARLWETDPEFEAAVTYTLDDDSEQLRWWFVTSANRLSEQAGFGIDNYHKDYTIRLFGFIVFDDSEDTEGTLATLAETVMDALDADTTLHGEFGAHASHVYEADPCAMEGPDMAEFMGFLVNRVQITKRIRRVAPY